MASAVLGCCAAMSRFTAIPLPFPVAGRFPGGPSLLRYYGLPCRPEGRGVITFQKLDLEGL
jgi:hypothetical protein